MSDRSRASLALLFAAFALVIGGGALLAMGSGLVQLLSGPENGPSSFVLGVMSLPIASFAAWGAWRLMQ